MATVDGKFERNCVVLKQSTKIASFFSYFFSLLNLSTYEIGVLLNTKFFLKGFSKEHEKGEKKILFRVIAFLKRMQEIFIKIKIF